MSELKPSIEILDWTAYNREDLVGYCESLIIRNNGEENYVLHKAHTYVENEENEEDNTPMIKAKHSKLEFEDNEKLMNAFENVKNNLNSNNFSWKETDFSLGYDISIEELISAHYVYRKSLKYFGSWINFQFIYKIIKARFF